MSADTPSGPAARLVAVVVTYNRLDKLKQTLARLLEAPAGVLSAVVVVDNASTDGTADWLAAQGDPRLTVQRSEHNLGGAGGFETGLRLATERFDPDWMVVMDDDAHPAPGALEAFFAETARQVVAGGATRLITAGGETSGAVVEGLALGTLDIGPEIDPGVPALRAGPSLAVALKSGNFGAPDFFAKAARVLEGSA